MATSQARILDTSIEEPFGRVFCDMVRLLLELRGFEHKFLPPYSPFFNGIECMCSEWKHYVKVGLQGHMARDGEAEPQERIRAFELVPAHATAYCRQNNTGKDCLSLIERVRNFYN
jgi:hypothetical protein